MACAMAALALEAKEKANEEPALFVGADWGDGDHGVLYYWPGKYEYNFNYFQPVSRKPFPVLEYPGKL